MLDFLVDFLLIFRAGLLEEEVSIYHLSRAQLFPAATRREISARARVLLLLMLPVLFLLFFRNQMRVKFRMKKLQVQVRVDVAYVLSTGRCSFEGDEL